MSENITSGGSTIHGVLVIVAAIIGVIGYIIRSRLNQKELQKQEAEAFQITRKEVADGYFKMIKSWEYLMDLAAKENLTKEQKAKFYLLKEMVKGSDYRGAYDSIAKMFGLNAPDKQEIESTVNNININIKRGSD